MNATTSAAQVVQLDGLIGMIFEATIFTFGLLARIWPTSFVSAVILVSSGIQPPHMSLVPRCITMMSGRAAVSQGGSWLPSAMPVIEKPLWPS